MVLKETTTLCLHQSGGDLATVCRHEGTLPTSCVDECTLYHLSIPSLTDKISPPDVVPLDVRPTMTRVHFAEERNEYFVSPRRLTDKAISTRWYSAEDLRSFRLKRTQRVHEMLKFDKNHKSVVNFQTVLCKACERCSQSLDNHKDNNSGKIYIPPELFQCMAKLLDKCQSRLGLEVVGVPQIALRQQKMRRALYRSVQIIQTQTSGNRTVEEYNDPSTTQEVLLRRACESYTQPFARYAQLVALAHAVAPER